MTAPRTTSGMLRRRAPRSLRSSPRLLAASRRFGAPRPRKPLPEAPIESSGAGGPPSSPDPSDLAAFASLRPWALAMARRLGARSGDVAPGKVRMRCRSSARASVRACASGEDA